MTDAREIAALAEKLEALGAAVAIRRDAAGWIAGVTVVGMRGIGPHEMAPLSFAERARSAIAATR